MAPALAVWHFVKIVSWGTSNLTKNNSLSSLPAQTTASQPSGLVLGEIGRNEGRGKGKSCWFEDKGWGKAVMCFCCFK